MSASARLRDGIPEPWATEWGEDRHGLFMGFSIGGVTQRLRYIPPGEFLMGSPLSELGRHDNEEQQLASVAEGFWLADTPCTQALWQAVMGENPSHFQDPKRPTLPVEQVSWDHCQIFLQRLNEHVPGLAARLPREAEWEYACRAGTTTATWADDLESEDVSAVLEPIAWYGHNSDQSTQPVRGKAENPWGLYDMLGNVWEWCQDPYERYARTAAQDRTDASEGDHRMIRGGSWLSFARFVRAANRYAHPPDYRGDSLGFRLARGQESS